MQAFQANLKRLEAADTQVLGVSADSPFANKAWAKEINVEFPLLSDMGAVAMRNYGVAKEYPMANGIKAIAARRVNFLIGKDGKILEIQLDSAAIDPTKIVEACERPKLKE